MAKKRASGHAKPGAGPSNPPFAVPDWPATTPKLVPLHEIIPYERNPRTHPPAQITLLAKLMKEHGVDQPIVVDEANVILKGHGRLLAAQEAGFETFPVVTHRGLSATEKTALRIEDNQVALLSGWDRGLLRGEMTELKVAGYDMPLLGFPGIELVEFMSGLGSADPAGEANGLGSLAARFGVVPFSVLNAREGWWQDRKRAWLALGIQSELGRGENLLKFSDTLLEPDPLKRTARTSDEEAQR
jgi:hypothetical protein